MAAKEKMRRKFFDFYMYPESVACPFCFNEADRNKLLFRKNEGEKQYDVILREYLYSVKSPAEANVKKLGKLINPEYYSERSVICDKNRISGIVDYDSEVVSNAVCPFCHNRISDFILDKVVKNIVLFSQNDESIGNFFGKDQIGMFLVSRLKHSNRDIEIRRRIHIGENLFQYFIDSLDRDDIIKNYIFTLWGNASFDRDNFYIEQIKKRSVEKADACVVYLDIASSSGRASPERGTYAAKLLDDIILTCGGEDSCIRKPFAVCAEISSAGLKNADGFEFEKALNEKYPEFLSCLHNYFEKYKVFAFHNGKLISSVNPVEWVFSNIRQ